MRSPHDRQIAALAVPALGSLVAEPLYVLADTAIVGNLGTDQLAGLALASTLLLFLHAVMVFLTYGTTGPVARLIGAGRHGDAARRSVQGIWLAALIGIAAAALLALVGAPVLGAFGAEGDVARFAERYLFVSLPGLPFLFVAMAANGSFHGRQNTTTPLGLAVTGAIANLV
ncbi:MAG: MATE family efflux transporter, partial [Acidimicrobiales bacterium]